MNNKIGQPKNFIPAMEPDIMIQIMSRFRISKRKKEKIPIKEKAELKTKIKYIKHTVKNQYMYLEYIPDISFALKIFPILIN